MAVEPFELSALAGWLKVEGVSTVRQHRLGHGVLVGHPPVPRDGERWMFKTNQHTIARSPSVEGVTLMMSMVCWPLHFASGGGTTSTGLRLGRAPGNHIVIEHPDISKLHARLMARPEGLAVADAGSSNGTLVNGARIPEDTPWLLRDRDLVTFGSAHLQYLLAETLLAVMAGA